MVFVQEFAITQEMNTFLPQPVAANKESCFLNGGSIIFYGGISTAFISGHPDCSHKVLCHYARVPRAINLFYDNTILVFGQLIAWGNF